MDFGDPVGNMCSSASGLSCPQFFALVAPETGTILDHVIGIIRFHPGYHEF